MSNQIHTARATLHPIDQPIACRNLNPDEYAFALFHDTLFAVTWDYRGQPECQTNTQTLDDSDIVQPVRVTV